MEQDKQYEKGKCVIYGRKCPRDFHIYGVEPNHWLHNQLQWHSRHLRSTQVVQSKPSPGNGAATTAAGFSSDNGEDENNVSYSEGGFVISQAT